MTPGACPEWPVAGGSRLFCLHDARGERGADLLRGAGEAVLDACLPDRTFILDAHAFLLLPAGAGHGAFLFDTGNGPARQGRLFDRLAGLGVPPEGVERVFITHMHGDHVGGLLDGGGGPAFPKATIHLAAAEKAYWTGEDGSGREPAANILAILETYGARVELFGGDAEIAPGVRAIGIPGHTPGHTAFLLADPRAAGAPPGGPPILVWGDLLHCLPVQMPHPRVNMAFDLDPDLAAATRLAMLGRAADENWRVAGMHVPYPGLGRVVRTGAGFAFVAVPSGP